MSYEFEEYQNQNILLSQERTLDIIEEPSNFSEEYNIDQFNELDLENFNNFEQESNEKPEVTEFPNEAYTDLMELIIKHNLNNKTDNAIIKFFNKHSNLCTLLLSKNIETGHKLMDLMNMKRLSYSKHRVLIHKNKKYFVYYRPVKNCIQNLLSNPEIVKNFVFKYQSLVIIYYLYYLYY